MSREASEDEVYLMNEERTQHRVQGGSDYIRVQAQVKILRAGSYLLVTGFMKNGTWRKNGMFKKLCVERRIRGEAGDVVVVDARFGIPFWGGTYDTKIYRDA